MGSIIGVSRSIEGSNQGTITDANGNFTLLEVETYVRGIGAVKNLSNAKTSYEGALAGRKNLPQSKKLFWHK